MEGLQFVPFLSLGSRRTLYECVVSGAKHFCPSPGNRHLILLPVPQMWRIFAWEMGGSIFSATDQYLKASVLYEERSWELSTVSPWSFGDTSYHLHAHGWGWLSCPQYLPSAPDEGPGKELESLWAPTHSKLSLSWNFWWWERSISALSSTVTTFYLYF